MGSFSIWHWLIVGILVLLLFGRGRFSEMMGDVAKGLKSFKKGMAEEDERPQTMLPPAAPSVPPQPIAGQPYAPPPVAGAQPPYQPAQPYPQQQQPYVAQQQPYAAQQQPYPQQEAAPAPVQPNPAPNAHPNLQPMKDDRPAS